METKYKERNSENPLVSIIVITYNSSKFVIETLESAKAQTYTNIELIISDDCSTDDTMDVCLKWIKENKNRFVRTELITDEKNTGIPANCNRGVKAARGEWIKLIAGDDCLRNDAINIYLNFILKHPEIEFIHADVQAYRNIFEAGNEFEIENPARIKFNKPITTANEQFQILLRLNPIYAATSFILKIYS